LPGVAKKNPSQAGERAGSLAGFIHLGKLGGHDWGLEVRGMCGCLIVSNHTKIAAQTKCSQIENFVLHLHHDL